MSNAQKQQNQPASSSYKGINPLPRYDDIIVRPPIIQSNSKKAIEKVQYQSDKKLNQSSSQQQKQQQQNIIVEHIKIIFMFYVQFGNKTNIQFLKSSKFNKAISDANLLSQNLSNKDLDIMYFQATKNTETLILNQFQDILLKIAIKLYPQNEMSKSFIILYKNHLEQLYQNIIEQTDFGQDLKLIESYRNLIDQEIIQYVQSVQQLLQKIHAFVFHDQNQKISQVQSQFVHFLQSFEIIPLIINQSKGQLIFFDLLHRESMFQFKQEGKYLFSFSKFVESLLIISFHQIPYENESRLEQVFIFFEKLENSPGFETFSKNHYQTKNEQTQLVMALSRVNSAKQSRVSTIHQNNQQISAQKIQNTCNDEKISIKYEKELKNIFEYFSSIGEPLNLINLKSIKYKKLLLTCGIIGQLITQVDADMIYIQATPKKKLDSTKSPKFKVNKLYDNDNQNGKMDFQSFYNSLQIIADKFFENDIVGLIEQFLLPLENQLRIEKQEQILQILMQLLQDPNITKLYEIMQQHFDPYFFYYTKDQLSLSGFMKFCQDFELANSLVSKSQLMHVFKAIASLNNIETIDQHQFVEAISVIALLVYQNIQDNEQKIIYLLERITQSEGAIKVSKQLGIVRNPQKSHLLELFRYQSLKDSQVRQEINFNNIVDQLEGEL